MLIMEPICDAGEYLNRTNNQCFPCPDNEYNSVPGFNWFCKKCKERCVRFAHVLHPCNATRDLMCDCDDDYRWQDDFKRHCIKIKNKVSELTTERIMTTEPSGFNSTSNVHEQDYQNSTYHISQSGSSWDNILPISLFFVVVAVFVIVAIFILVIRFFYMKKKRMLQREGSRYFKGIVTKPSDCVDRGIILTFMPRFHEGKDEYGSVLKKGEDANLNGTNMLFNLPRENEIRYTDEDHVVNSWNNHASGIALAPSSLCAENSGLNLNLKSDDELKTTHQKEQEVRLLHMSRNYGIPEGRIQEV